MGDFTRGQKIRFASTFKDAVDQDYTPDDPTVTIDYPAANRRRANRTISMTLEGSEWVAGWASSEASRAGEVYWTVYSGPQDDPESSEDGHFMLGANASNLEGV